MVGLLFIVLPFFIGNLSQKKSFTPKRSGNNKQVSASQTSTPLHSTDKVVGKPGIETTKIADALTLSQQGDPETAMINLFQIFDQQQNNQEALDAAHMILANEGDKLKRMTYYDPLLNRFFAQCDQCGASWVVNPLYARVSRIVVSNPAGGKCELCGKIYCRNCAIHSGTKHQST